MKIFFAAMIAATFVGFASVASANCDCGTLQVATMNSGYIFLLEQGAGAIEMTANHQLSTQLAKLAGQSVCLNVAITSNQHGGATAEATGFCSIK